MSETQSASFYEKMERLTRKWWFYVLLFAVIFLPPYTSQGLGYYRDLWKFSFDIGETMYYRKELFEAFMPLLHLVVAVIIFLVVLLGHKFGRIFSVFVGLNYVLIIIVQAYMVTDEYGTVVLSMLSIWCLMIVLAWFWDAILGKTDYTFRKLPWQRYWVVPMAFIAFWNPDDAWDLNPRMLWISTSPIAFCMMTVIYLAIYRLLYPNVNLPAFRVTSFIGIILSLFTMGVGAARGGSEGVYWVLLHIPILSVSVESFVVGLRPGSSSLA